MFIRANKLFSISLIQSNIIMRIAFKNNEKINENEFFYKEQKYPMIKDVRNTFAVF